MMSKKQFILLADMVKDMNRFYDETGHAGMVLRAYEERIAAFCQSQNPRFNRVRWFAYVNGECGPCGGTIKKPKGKKTSLKA